MIQSSAGEISTYNVLTKILPLVINSFLTRIHKHTPGSLYFICIHIMVVHNSVSKNEISLL